MFQSQVSLTMSKLRWSAIIKMKAYLALGSNLGDRMNYLREAVQRLDEIAEIEVLEKAKIYETDPYGEVPQDNFLNSAIAIETTLEPLSLLKKIHEVEASLDRERLIHWGPRTIDIDILYMDGIEMTEEVLTIPHKELTKRSFVLIPLSDVFKKKELLGQPLERWIEQTGNANEVRNTNESW